MRKKKDANIDWNYFASLSKGEKRKFLKQHNLQYKDVPRCRKCKHVFFDCKCNDEEYKKRMQQRHAELNKSFEEKLAHSKEIISKLQKQLEESPNKKAYLSYSGGIDSECCVQLCKDLIAKGLVTVVIGDTLVEFPETRKRWEELQKEIPSGQFIIVRPERGMSFKVITKKYGLPVYTRSSDADKEKREATEKCCLELKKKPLKKATKDADFQIMGLRVEESHYRRLSIFRMGDFSFSKKDHNWRIYPIAFWSIDDVWEFQRREGFNYNKIYDYTNCGKTGFYQTEDGTLYQIRTGCWCCPQALKRGYLEWLERYYPKFYDALVNKLGLKDHVIWAKVEARKKKIKRLKVKPCGESI